VLRAIGAAALLAFACAPSHAQSRDDAEGLDAFARVQSQGRDRMTMSEARRSIREMQPNMSLRQSVRGCTNQTKDQATERITACTRVLESRKASGETAGVTYALRGLAYLDRGDTPHAIGDLNHAVTLAPDFAPAYQNRGNAWYARGN
jgi:tetratricopeptide (TPR) repeat protein